MIGVGCLGAVAVAVQRTWLGPGAITAGVWLVATVLPLVVGMDLPIHPPAYAAVLVTVFAVIVGSSVGMSDPTLPTTRPVMPCGHRWRQTWWLYYGLIAVGSFGPVILFRDSQSLVHAKSFFELAMYASMARYEGDLTLPISVRALGILTYTGTMIAAFVTAIERPHERRWLRSLAWTLPLLASMAVQTAKMVLLTGIVLWIAGWVAGQAYSRGAYRFHPRQVTGHLLGAAGLLSLLMLMTQALRMNRLHSVDDVLYAFDRLRIYFIGHMPVFGHWLTHLYPHQTRYLWGVESFSGLAQLLGVHERQVGLYETTADFTSSNIYTALRPLLEDFGLAGGVVFLLVFAAIGGWGWRLLVRGRLVGAGPLAALIAYVVFSPIASVLTYSMADATLVLFTLWAAWMDLDVMSRRYHGALASTNR